MADYPLFSVAELEAAFALVLPAAEAARWAREWFDRHAANEDLDENGRFLIASEDEAYSQKIRTHSSEVDDGASRRSKQHRPQTKLGDLDPAAFAEMYLMSWSPLHLHLLALSSQQMLVRVAQLLGQTSERTLAQCEDVRRLAEDRFDRWAAS